MSVKVVIAAAGEYCLPEIAISQDFVPIQEQLKQHGAGVDNHLIVKPNLSG
jgi:hypothetical protein